MKNKNLFRYSVMIICALLSVRSVLSAKSDPIVAINKEIIAEKKEKVDAYTFKKWKEGLRQDPMFDLSKIASKISLILSDKQEQTVYFERMESFIPNDSSLMIGVDSNIHWQDLAELASSVIDCGQNAAKRGDLLQCRTAFLLVPEIVLRPINLVPPDEVMYVGHKTPGEEVYSFTYLSAYLSFFYLRGSLVSINKNLNNPAALDPVFDMIETTYRKLKANSESLTHQSKQDSAKKIEIEKERNMILKKFMISIKPKINIAFQQILDHRRTPE